VLVIDAPGSRRARNVRLFCSPKSASGDVLIFHRRRRCVHVNESREGKSCAAFRYYCSPSYSRDGRTHILLIDSMGRLWRSNCYSKFRRLAERRCYFGPRSHNRDERNLLWPYEYSLSFHDPPGPAIHSGQKSQLAWRCCFPLADSNCWPSFSSVASSHNSCT
jgi:hypothetical protein